MGALLLSSIYLFGKLAAEVIDRQHGSGADGDLSYDHQVLNEIRKEGPPRAVEGAFKALAHYTKPKYIVSVTVLGAALLARKHRRATVFLVGSVAGSLVTERLLKSLFGRPRPKENRGDSTTSSFPSGHTSTATAVALSATLVARREFPKHYPLVAWVVLPFALLVAASRPLDKMHYPSDVLAGNALGTVAVLGLYEWYGRESSISK